LRIIKEIRLYIERKAALLLYESKIITADQWLAIVKIIAAKEKELYYN
jgi:hypothetical protein